jgi:glycosyltransferase involved in cell wall biosynthesis
MPGSRRVLMIVENLPVPFDRRVWLEATALQRDGYEVSVICPRMKGFNAAYEEIEGVRIHRYRAPPDAKGALGFAFEFTWCFLATTWISLRIAFTGPGFDVIHACNPPDTFWLLARFWSLFGRRFIFDHHDLSPEMFTAKFGRSDGRLYRGLLWLERRAFRSADVVITTNESHKRIAVKRGGRRPGDVYVVRSGPDFSRFATQRRDSTLAHGKPHLLVYLGEMCIQDNVDGLVHVIKLLRDTYNRNDFHCQFVGGGPHQPEVKALANALGIDDIVTFTGRVSDADLCRILSSATIGIDPTTKNDWSDKSTMNKIIEYMFFGLPVVAFDLAETRVSAGEAGVFADEDSQQDLARAISALLDDPERRAEMAAIGRTRVRESLSFDHSVPVLLAAYERCFPARQSAAAVHNAPRAAE